MPTLEIDGVGRVEVGAEFTRLSPEAQAQAVDEIISSVWGDGPQAPAAARSGAKAAALDVAKSAGVGVGEGAIGMAGLPGDIEAGAGGLVRRGYRALTGDDAPGWLSDMASPLAVPRLVNRALGRGAQPGQQTLPTSAGLRGQAEAVTGPFYQAQTTAGDYARTVGQFIPATAGMGAGGAIRYGLIPGLASEAAGQATEGTGLEPIARTGAALAAGGAAALQARPAAPASILRDAVPNLDDATVAAAQRLMDDAAAMGAPITTAEAIQQVTNSGTRLGDVQRVVEQSRGGGPRLREFMAGRPEAVRRAGLAALNPLGPQAGSPAQIGPRIRDAAQGTLDATRQRINDAASPFYSVARKQTVPQAKFQAVAKDPAFTEALRRVRADPIKGADLKGLPDNSIAVIDEVKKELDTIIRSASNPLNVNRDLRLAELAGRGRKNAVWEAAGASPDYAQALRIERQGRRQVLEPMRRGPIGRAARTDDFGGQADIFLNPSPLPGSQDEIRTAVQDLIKRDRVAARQLVRTRLEQVFNETAGDLVSGPNPFGGPKFRKAMAGNSQQAKNLQAVVTEVAGKGAWDGLQRTLTVFEAMGRRQPVGSQTEFNRLLGEELKRGGVVGYSAALAASPRAAMGAAKSFYESFRYGRNTEDLAKLLTDPKALHQIRTMALLPANSVRAKAIAAALAINARQAWEGGQEQRRRSR